jgi:hypothetical protein
MHYFDRIKRCAGCGCPIEPDDVVIDGGCGRVFCMASCVTDYYEAAGLPVPGTIKPTNWRMYR